jgi:hypothetical protein
MKTENVGTNNPTTDLPARAPACPGCAKIKNEWPGEGYSQEGESYCCQGCAEGTGCICGKVAEAGFSLEGQLLTQAEKRPGEQRAGSLLPQGELSGQRDARGTEEAIDEAACSDAPGGGAAPKQR